MTTYNVHIYREMRLVFGGIEVNSPETAAAIARDKPTEEADSIDDCEGETLAALVDVQGDQEYEHSRVIDFEQELLRKASTALLAACRMVVDRWERGDLAEAVLRMRCRYRQRGNGDATGRQRSCEEAVFRPSPLPG